MELIFFLIVGFFLIKYIKFSKSEYSIRSRNSFAKTIFNKGNYGEYLTFSYLEKLPGYKKIVTNIYVKKEDGKTTEIDLVMLHETGIYVFESKNYSGWIFGDEKNKSWTQTLKGNNKNYFYNPIWQNNGHIRALANFLPEVSRNSFKSYIIFSERCELKKINIESADVKVIKRQNLVSVINKDISNSTQILTREKIDEIYFRKLLQLSAVTDELKLTHIENISKAVNKK